MIYASVLQTFFIETHFAQPNFSRPLKKGLHLKSISDSAIFPPTSRCSLKKKKGLHLKSISDSAIFPPTSRCSLKKKKRSSPRIDLSFRYFCPKIKVFSKPAVPKLCAAKVCESCCTYLLLFSQ